MTTPLPVTRGCASWAGNLSEPLPESKNYSYRKIVILLPAYGVYLHTLPEHKRALASGPWPSRPEGRRKEGGCTPLALSMSSALLPLPIPIKTCSQPCLTPVLPASGEPGPGCGGVQAGAQALLSDAVPSAAGSSWWLSCHGIGRDRLFGILPHPLNMLSAWHVRTHPQSIVFSRC